MANTSSQIGSMLITDVPQTGSDVTFAFNVKTFRALIQCDADSTSIYADAATSTSKGGFKLPTVNKAAAQEFLDLAGRTVVFNGTNSTNVQIIEFLGASS